MSEGSPRMMITIFLVVILINMYMYMVVQLL